MPLMSWNQALGAGSHEPARTVNADLYAAGLRARKLRSIGQRRRDAEMNLEQHLQDAQRKHAAGSGPDRAASH